MQPSGVALMQKLVLVGMRWAQRVKRVKFSIHMLEWLLVVVLGVEMLEDVLCSVCRKCGGCGEMMMDTGY